MIANNLKERNVDVVAVVENEAKKHTRYKSFKLTVKRVNANIIDSANFWPSNVFVRRWHNLRQRRLSGDDQPLETAATTAQ